MRQFRKSSRSGGSGGNCVEWAVERKAVFVRDSKDPDGPELRMTHDEWAGFAAAAATGGQHDWVRRTAAGVTVVRHPQELRFTPAEWEAFAAGAALGECVSRPG